MLHPQKKAGVKWHPYLYILWPSFYNDHYPLSRFGAKVLISKTRNQLKYISFKDSNVDSQAYQDNFIHIRLMFFFSFKLDPYQLNNLYKGYY